MSFLVDYAPKELMISPQLFTCADSVRQRALRLVRLAYSSISADDFAVFVGMTVDKAIEGTISTSSVLSSYGVGKY